MSVRAKMVCVRKTNAVDQESGKGGTVVLRPVVSGSAENESFYQYTPSGELVLSTINQAAFEQFDVPKEYYVDITPANVDSNLELAS